MIMGGPVLPCRVFYIISKNTTLPLVCGEVVCETCTETWTWLASAVCACPVQTHTRIQDSYYTPEVINSPLYKAKHNHAQYTIHVPFIVYNK